MTRILIVFASHYGQTSKIAQTIARQLTRGGASVELADATKRTCPSPAAFDAIVIGSRIELGRHSPDLVRYLRTHLDHLRRLPSAVFVVCNTAAKADGGRDPAGYAQALFNEVQWTPMLHASFAGALPYRRYGFILRFMMKRIAKSAGQPTDTSRDHELTDWAQVTAFATQVAALLPAGRDVRHA